MKKIITLLIITIGINSNAQCWKAISAENNHVAAIKNDGTLWMWGANESSQLGNNSTTSKNAPIQIGGTANWLSVAVGNAFTIALKADGTLWSWGKNSVGQLGIGSTVSKAVPTQVGSDTNWSFVSAGEQHVVAKKTDGTLWVWGATKIHLDTQGDPVVETYNQVPTQIGSGFNWTTTKISAGGFHNLAVKPDGTLWAWGSNVVYQLGNGSTTDLSVPTQIGTDTDWKFVATGTGSSFAIKTSGKLYAWGAGDSRLGLGALTNHVAIPTQVGTDTNWNSIEGGNVQTIGLKTTGELYTWGDNSAGQLGIGSTIEKNTPTKIGVATDWSIITSGDSQNYAIKTDGSLFSVGNNTSGQLGDATNANKNAFTSISCPSNLSTSDIAETNFSIYPNPVSTVLNIQLQNNMEIDGIVITDVMGKIMLQQTANLNSVDVQHFANGVYFVQVLSGNSKLQTKFIKQ